MTDTYTGGTRSIPSGTITTSTSTSTTSGTVTTMITGAGIAPTSRTTKNVENAVYSHIRAVRALGRTTINSVEIAEALNLPLSEVQRALENLGNKGVKIAG